MNHKCARSLRYLLQGWKLEDVKLAFLTKSYPTSQYFNYYYKRTAVHRVTISQKSLLTHFRQNIFKNHNWHFIITKCSVAQLKPWKKVVDLIPHCKLFWIKPSTKCINVEKCKYQIPFCAYIRFRIVTNKNLTYMCLMSCESNANEIKWRDWVFCLYSACQLTCR